MTKIFLALGAAAVALAHPGSGRPPRNHGNRHHARICAKWRHGHCVRWDNRGYRVSSAPRAVEHTATASAPAIRYTSYRALPRTYVSRYDLSPNYRYVYQDNYIYVVNPRTYAVERIIDALTR